MYNQRPSNQSSYSCTALLGTGKAGHVRPDADGYYTYVLGALDVENSRGEFYAYQPAKHMFEDNSALMRRIKDGTLKGEYGHPPKLPGMSNRDFIMRLLEVRESEVCVHIRRLTLVENQFKDARGQPIVAIIGEIRPTGPRGPALAASLENPSENVCFSIRSFTNNFEQGRRTIKVLREVVTWDYVNEPGIHLAKKWHSPALESLQDALVTPEQLASVARLQSTSGVGLESSGGVSAASVARSLGWDILASIENGQKRPPSSRW